LHPRVATDAPIDLALGLLTSLLSAITFISILWSVGGDLDVHVSGLSVTLPGYLVIAVIVVNFLLAPVLAWILCAPKYLTGVMGLGEVVQVTAAFVTVQGALNWFVDNYHRLADWVSSVNRVSSLLLALDQVDAQDRTLISATILRVEPHQPMRQAAVVSYHVPL
jgi:ABC-type uncharacterized transport system fused permease/ATPase subunit